MANVTIDDLPPTGTALDGTEEVPIWVDGVTEKCTTQDIADLAPAPEPVVLPDFSSLNAHSRNYLAQAANSTTIQTTPVGWSISQNASTATTPALDGTTLIGSMTKVRLTSAIANNNSPQVILGEPSSPFNTSAFRRISADATLGGFKLQLLFSVPTGRTTQAVWLAMTTAVSDNTLGGIVSTAYATHVSLGQDQDDGTLQWMTRTGSGAVTKTPVGVTWAALQGKLCMLTMYCAPGGTTIEMTLRNMTDGVNYTASLSGATIPAADTPLHPYFQISTGTLSSTAVELDFMRCTLQVYEKEYVA